MAFNRIIYRSFRLFIWYCLSTAAWGLCCWNSPWSSSSNVFIFYLFYRSYTYLWGTFYFLTSPGISSCVQHTTYLCHFSLIIPYFALLSEFQVHCTFCIHLSYHWVFRYNNSYDSITTQFSAVWFPLINLLALL